MNKTALTYDDIQLIPEYSDIKTRSSIDLSTYVTKNWKLKIPIVASPMDTVCEYKMAKVLNKFGGVGCVHRFMSIEEQCKIIIDLKSDYDSTYPLMAAIGVNGDYIERAYELVRCGVNIIIIDVAHGHHKNVYDAIIKLKAFHGSKVDVIAGNVATSEGAEFLINSGADGVRVGIGGGSLCTTRIKTGFGVPNITCISEIKEVSKYIMADGGIRNSGDIAKALAMGASTVMLGSILAGTSESPGKIIEKPQGLYKRYRGSASLETKMSHGLPENNIEGESTIIPFKGSSEYILTSIIENLKSAFSYGGARNLTEFTPSYNIVTNSGIKEANPHLIL